jgi:hypothetical protein
MQISTVTTIIELYMSGDMIRNTCPGFDTLRVQCE